MTADETGAGKGGGSGGSAAASVNQPSATPLPAKPPATKEAARTTPAAKMQPVHFLVGLAIFFGALVYGALLGVILGLSLVPAAAVILTALLASLGAVVVLRKGNGSTLPSVGTKYLALGAFGLGCMGALLGGMHLRAHPYFSPTPMDRYQEWTRLGLSAPEARELVLVELGLIRHQAEEGDESSTEEDRDAGDAEDDTAPEDAAESQQMAGQVVLCEGMKADSSPSTLQALAEDDESVALLQRAWSAVEERPEAQRSEVVAVLVEVLCPDEG